MVKPSLFVLCIGVAFAGCAPELEDTSELVSAPQVLAVRASPPEAKPGTVVAYEALVGAPGGPVAPPSLDWAYCTERKPLSEQGSVAPTCLVPSGSTVARVGAGSKVTATIPANVCRVFGPDRPEPKNGEPPGRPADPDVTGGYYQPLRLRIPSPEAYTVADSRVACGLSGVTQDELATFVREYRPNENPLLGAVNLDGVAATPWETDPNAVLVAKAGASLALEATWSPCASGDAPAVPCGSESYIVFDAATRTFVTRPETLRVSWFVTSGDVAEPSGGRVGGDPTLAVTTTWTSPAAGDAWLWVVLRDDRGGTDWRSFHLRVE